MQVQNLALARKKVILDVDPIHCLEMSPQNSNRDQISDSSRFTFFVLNGMKGLQSYLQVLLIDFVPLRNTRIQVPAVIVEARLTGKSLDFSAGFLLQMS